MGTPMALDILMVMVMDTRIFKKGREASGGSLASLLDGLFLQDSQIKVMKS